MNIEKALEILGYTKEWVDFGIINADFLKIQYEAFIKSGKKNSDHYRWAGFLNYMRSKQELTDEELQKILALKEIGVDLSKGRIAELIYSGILNDDQFEKINNDLILKSEA